MKKLLKKIKKIFCEKNEIKSIPFYLLSEKQLKKMEYDYYNFFQKINFKNLPIPSFDYQEYINARKYFICLMIVGPNNFKFYNLGKIINFHVSILYLMELKK